MSAATVAPEATMWWVRIEREFGPDVLVGPYRDRKASERALMHASHIDYLCSQDALDAYSVALGQDEMDPEWRVQHIDPTNPDHTGVKAPRKRVRREDEAMARAGIVIGYGPSEECSCTDPYCAA